MRYSLILTILLCLGFSGCGGGSSEEASPALDPGAAQSDSEPVRAAPDEPQDDAPAAEPQDPEVPAVELVGAIPLLERMNDPFAISLRDHLSKLPPVDAANYVMDEVLKTADEFSQAVSALQPTLQDYETKFPPLVEVQLKMRTLLETAHYLASKVPEGEQEMWKSKFQSQAGLKLSELSGTLRNQSMAKAAQEISNSLMNFDAPFQDLEEMLTAEIAANAPAPRAGGGGMSPSDSNYDPGHDSSYDYSYDSSSSSRSGLESSCKNFFTSYTPGKVDPKKMDSVLTSLTRAARQELLGYPRSTSDSGYDSNYSSRSSSSSRRTTTSTRSSGLELTFEPDETTPVAGLAGLSHDGIAPSTRKSIAYALKQMLHEAPDVTFGGRVAAAYCVFAEEDFVPEVAKFMEKFGKNLTEKDLEFLTSLSIESDYGSDPRVQFFLGLTIIAIESNKANDPKKASTSSSSNKANETKIFDAFRAAPGVGRFLVKGLNVGAATLDEKANAERVMALRLLFAAGDPESALEVVKLLNDENTVPMFKKAALDVLGQCGDERVVISIIRSLRVSDLQDQAKGALIRIGAPAEAMVLTIFNNMGPEMDLVALEIVQQIGSWDSVTKLSAQQKLYSEAKTAEEQEQASEAEKSKLTLETSEKIELIKKTIEAGATIISRMQGSKAPNFDQRSGGGSRGYSSSYESDPSVGYSPDYDSSSSPDSRSSARQKDDGKSPRTLVGAGEKEPGSAPVAWASSLADSSTAMFIQMGRLFGRSRTPELAMTAGTEMHAYDWVEGYYNTAATQLNKETLRIMNDPASIKAINSSLERIKTRRANYVREKTLFNRSKSDVIKKAFNQGYSIKPPAETGTR